MKPEANAGQPRSNPPRWLLLIAGLLLFDAAALGVVAGLGLADLAHDWLTGGYVPADDDWLVRAESVGLAASLFLGVIGFRWMRRLKAWAGLGRLSAAGWGRFFTFNVAHGVAVAFVAICVFVRWSGPWPVGLLAALLGAGLVWMGLRLLVAAHELGHAAAGWLVGWELHKLQIGLGADFIHSAPGSRVRFHWRFFPSSGLTVEGLFHLWEADFRAALQSFDGALAAERFPAAERISVRAYRAAALTGAGEIESARSTFEAIIAEASEAEKLTVLALFASIPIRCGRSELLPEAARWLAAALELKPDWPGLRATEALLWMEAGDVARGEPALHEIIRGNYDDADRGTAAFYLAHLLQQRGRPSHEVARWRRRAIRWHPQPWLLRRVKAELAE
jgi:hypothetical protein